MRDAIFAELSVDRIMEDARFLCEEAPHRISGTAMERKAAEYIKARFDEIGVPMILHEIDGYISIPGKASIEVLGDEPRTIEANTFAQSAKTPPEGIEAEIVHVGAGGVDDYEGRDVAGRISLAELSYAPPRPEKVRIAGAMGAAGQIIMNWGLPEHDTLPMGTCKPMWGNPTPANFDDLPKIPVVGVRLKDGLWLAEKAKKGPLRIRLKSEVENRWGKIIQPMAWLAGNEEPEKFVVVGGHYDAWGPAASDNAAGNAEVIEIARAFAKHRSKLRRSICFAFWGAHETGIMEGSTWFVDRYWDKIDKGGLLYLNIDSAAMQGATHFQATASYPVQRFHKELCREVLGIEDAKTATLARTGDQSFFGVGVPAIYASHKHSPEQQKEWRGATLGWWYHSQFDTMERVDPELLAESVRMHAAYTYELVTRPVLPFDVDRVTEIIRARLGELAPLDRMELGIAELAADAEALHERATQFTRSRDAAARDEDDAKRFNETALRLCRVLTPAASTVSGRWDQDTYGLTALKTAVPGLYGLEKMATLDPSSAEFKLEWTAVRRQRNRIADALRDAARELDRHGAA